MINQINCTAAGSNTGIPDCALTLKNVIYGFLVPNSFVLSSANLLTPEATLAALQAASINDNPLLRIYPLPQIVGMTDGTEETVVETLSYGTPVPVRDGVYNLTFRYTAGGNCVNNSLRSFNNKNMRWIGMDSNGVLFGTKVGATMMGIPLDYFEAKPFRFNDGAGAVANFQYMVSFKPVYVNEGLGFIQLNTADVLAIGGLKNINLQLFSARAGNIIKVYALTGCGGVNLYDTYSASLVTASNWIVTEFGLNISITSVALDANAKAFTITLDTTDPDYNAAGPFTVTLAAPSVLSGNGISGFEGKALIVA